MKRLPILMHGQKILIIRQFVETCIGLDYTTKAICLISRDRTASLPASPFLSVGIAFTSGVVFQNLYVNPVGKKYEIVSEKKNEQ